MKATYPRGYWKQWLNVEAAVQAIIDATGHFPSQKEIQGQGSGLCNAIATYHGGLSNVRQKMGYELERAAAGHWEDFANVEREIRGIMETLGHFPTNNDLRRLGKSSLSTVILNHGGFNAVRRKMGLVTERADWRTWHNFAELEAAIRKVVAEVGHFPSHREFVKLKQRSLLYGMDQFGGIDTIKEQLGFAPRETYAGFWQESGRIEAEVERLINQLGHFPNTPELEEFGRIGLKNAVAVHAGGIKALRKKMNHSTAEGSPGYWQDWQNIERALSQLIEEIGHVPTADELEKRGKGKVVTACWKHHGGYYAVLERLGLAADRRTANGFWRKWENVEAALRQLAGKLGRIPEYEDLRKPGLGGLKAAIFAHHGGFKAVRERMGYAPVTQDHIQAHLGDLVDIFLALKPAESLEAFLARVREDYPTESAFTAWLDSQTLKT